jgi:hypothetical protein
MWEASIDVPTPLGLFGKRVSWEEEEDARRFVTTAFSRL